MIIQQRRLELHTCVSPETAKVCRACLAEKAKQDKVKGQGE